MDKKTKNIILVSALVLVGCYWLANKKKPIEKPKTNDIEEKKEEEIISEPETTTNFVGELETVELGTLDDSVIKVKKTLAYITGIKMNNTPVYDYDLLLAVRTLLKDTVVLMDYETGRICKRFFLNLDYVLSNLHSEHKPLSHMAKINTSDCTWIKKGDKGKDVLKLNDVINILTNSKNENALFTKEFGKTIDKIFLGSQIYDNTTKEHKVCKNWVYSVYTIIENLNKLNER